MPTETVVSPDLQALKRRQQATWASGDFSRVAARIVHEAEQLCEHADLQAGWRVLDVATGSGNAALAAARRGCEAIGLDYVPALLDRARLRAEAEHLEATFVEGDAEALPFPDASFDAATSIYGAMFAPDQARTAAEMARVVRPGGRIALASWTPEGFIGEMFRLISRYVPPPAGVAPAVLWGDPSHLETLFAGRIRSASHEKRRAIFRFRTAEEQVDFFRTYYGPTLKTFSGLPPDRQAYLARELADLHRAHDRNRGAGPVAVDGEYLESVLVRA